MYGKKMVQLKEAMNAILAELRPKDFFNLIEFSHPVTVSLKYIFIAFQHFTAIINCN